MTQRSNPIFRVATTLAILVAILNLSPLSAQYRRSPKSIVSGGVIVDTQKIDSLAKDSVNRETETLTLKNKVQTPQQAADTLPKEKFQLFRDSTSLSKMCWTAAVLPGYGQIYNKQYWKLPIFYATLGAGIALYINENKTYKPLKAKYNELISVSSDRTPELDEVQADMINSNTRRQIYFGTALASYIYFLGDAAVNYSTNDVSSVKKATTLAMICPGAGQIYNKSYWKVPFVIGGFATMIYVIDWNNRGFKRFKSAYSDVTEYNANPDLYPDGPFDEFSGRYDSSYIKSIRDDYRRNRDFAIILTAGLYILQIVDAHVDAHLQDFDVSDDLTLNIAPSVDYAYSPIMKSNCTTFGFKLNLSF